MKLVDADYLDQLPQAVPEGRLLVHNHIRSTRLLGSCGFRAWLASDPEGLVPCDCGWASELGPHFRAGRPFPMTDKDRCAGCGQKRPEWPTGWLFTDEPYAAWCPACKTDPGLPLGVSLILNEEGLEVFIDGRLWPTKKATLAIGEDEYGHFASLKLPPSGGGRPGT